MEEWIEFEEAFAEKSSLTPAVYDANGALITDSALWCNTLCQSIKKNPAAREQICSLAHQNMAMMAKNIRKPVVEECDVGMVKIVIPVFVDDEFVGAVGGCGRLLPDSEIDESLIAMVSGLDEKDVSIMAKEVTGISDKEAEDLAEYLKNRIEDILKEIRSK